MHPILICFIVIMVPVVIIVTNYFANKQEKKLEERLDREFAEATDILNNGNVYDAVAYLKECDSRH